MMGLFVITEAFYQFLYELLAERDPAACISHHTMPTFEEHCAFVRSTPYEAWYVIVVDEHLAGAIYLTKQDEIGIALKSYHHGNGLAKWAMDQLMEFHPRKRYLANISPRNEASQKFFTKHGFELIQHTYALKGALA
jgi:RimJ/RimL family protein N-acetyltransferase